MMGCGNLVYECYRGWIATFHPEGGPAGPRAMSTNQPLAQSSSATGSQCKVPLGIPTCWSERFILGVNVTAVTSSDILRASSQTFWSIYDKVASLVLIPETRVFWLVTSGCMSSESHCILNDGPKS